MPETLTAPPAAKPAAPASAPKSPVAPPTGRGVPTPAPSSDSQKAGGSTPTQPSRKEWKSADSEIDEMMGESSRKEEARRQPQTEQPKPEIKAPEPKEETKEEESKDAPSTQEDTAPDAKESDDSISSILGEESGPAEVAPKTNEPEPKTPKELRSAYAEVKSEREKLKAENARVSAKLREYENNKPSTEPLTTRIKELEGKLESYEKQTQLTDYTRSQDFQEKYAKPYEQSWAKAIHDLTQLTIEDGEGNRRQVTPKDIEALASLPLAQLDETAEQWFGKSAHRVIRHVESIRELAEKQHNAIEQAKTNAEKHHTENQNRSKAEREQLNDIWQKAHKLLQEKMPEMFGSPETDPEGNAAFERGLRFYDETVNPDSGKNLPADVRVKRMAAIRNKAAAYDRLALHNKSLKEENAKLKAELKQFEKSEPSGGSTKAQDKGGDGGGESAEAELDRLSKSGL